MAFYDLKLSAKFNRNIDIALSTISILLVFKLIIDFIALWYQIRKKIGKEKFQESIIVGLGNLYTIISPIIIGLGLLSILGLNPGEVFTSLSIVAAALAVVSKEFVGELFIGIMNGFSNKIDIGDYIRVDDEYGSVVDIGLQKVTLETDDHKIIYIPNLKYHNADVINFTKSSDGLMSVRFQLDVKNARTINEIEQLAKSVLVENNQLVDNDFLKVEINRLYKEYTEISIHYRLNYVNQEDHAKIKKAILAKLYNDVVVDKHNFYEG